ncbi:putative plant self-incompatibility S1 [Helianthus annuus]|nr:putative plant self-incompatibility S1 [Helianthus annuus]
MSFSPKLFFSVFLLFHLCSVMKATTQPSSKWLEPYRVTITNQDVPVVLLRCDDLDASLLKPGNSTSWKFRKNFWESNKYGCRFYWVDDNFVLQKQAEFTVFDDEVANKLCGTDGYNMNRCYWYVTRDGFYYSKNDGSDWNLLHGWNNIG